MRLKIDQQDRMLHLQASLVKYHITKLYFPIQFLTSNTTCRPNHPHVELSIFSVIFACIMNSSNSHMHLDLTSGWGYTFLADFFDQKNGSQLSRDEVAPFEL